MTMREEFEQMVRSQNVCTRLSRQSEAVGGAYRTISVQRAWLQYQAAYAAGQKAEREACAQYAENYDLGTVEGHAIAAAIRNRGEE